MLMLTSSMILIILIAADLDSENNDNNDNNNKNKNKGGETSIKPTEDDKNTILNQNIFTKQYTTSTT